MSLIKPATATPGAVRVKRPPTALESLLILFSRHREASIAAVAVVLVIYFQVGSGGQFLSSQFLSVVLRDTGRLGLIAVAQVMLMITGEIDLSVSGTFAFAPYIMVLLSITLGVPLFMGAIIALVIGVLVGVLNGIITVRFRVPSLITTVGTLFFLQGLVVWINDSQADHRAGGRTLQRDLRSEPLQPFGPPVLLACNHRLYAFPLDLAGCVGSRDGLEAHHLRPAHRRDWQQYRRCAGDRRPDRSHQNLQLHDCRWLRRLRRHHQCGAIFLRRSAGRQSFPHPSGNRGSSHRGAPPCSAVRAR